MEIIMGTLRLQHLAVLVSTLSYVIQDVIGLSRNDSHPFLTNCPGDQWKPCPDGTRICLTRHYRSTTIFKCLDDECRPGERGEETVPCDDQTQCFPPENRCNIEADCHDRSDEAYCGGVWNTMSGDTKMKIFLVGPTVLVALFGVTACICAWKRRRKERQQPKYADEAEALQNQGAGTSGGDGSGDTKGFSLAPTGASSMYVGHPEYYYTD